MAGQPLTARIVVREDNNGQFYYDHSLTEMPPPGEEKSEPAGNPPGVSEPSQALTTNTGRQQAQPENTEPSGEVNPGATLAAAAPKANASKFPLTQQVVDLQASSS